MTFTTTSFQVLVEQVFLPSHPDLKSSKLCLRLTFFITFYLTMSCTSLCTGTSRNPSDQYRYNTAIIFAYLFLTNLFLSDFLYTIPCHFGTVFPINCLVFQFLSLHFDLFSRLFRKIVTLPLFSFFFPFFPLSPFIPAWKVY